MKKFNVTLSANYEVDAKNYNDAIKKAKELASINHLDAGMSDVELIDSSVICGFVFCHGKKDFSAWEVDLYAEDREAIEKILTKYETCGTSERNVWDKKFSDVFCEAY